MKLVTIYQGNRKAFGITFIHEHVYFIFLIVPPLLLKQLRDNQNNFYYKYINYFKHVINP